MQKLTLYTWRKVHQFSRQFFIAPRTGSSIIDFPSESIVFAQKWVIRSTKRAIHSYAHFWWATWAICSFNLSEMSKWVRSKWANSHPWLPFIFIHFFENIIKKLTILRLNAVWATQRCPGLSCSGQRSAKLSPVRRNFYGIKKKKLPNTLALWG